MPANGGSTDKALRRPIDADATIDARTTDKARTHTAAVIVAIGTGIAMALISQNACAIDMAQTLRKIAKVADDVPIAKLDDIAADSASSKFACELVAKTGGKIDDVTDRTRVLRELLMSCADGLPPAVVKQLDSLDGPAQEAMAVLARGSKAVGESIPDLAERSRLIAEGGADTLLVIGRYEDLADDAVKFSAAARAGWLPTPSGGGLSLQDFDGLFLRSGDRGKRFWDVYVRPNWKYWLGSVALAMVLATPEEYLDEAGNFVKGATEKLARVGGKALGGAIGTVGTVVEETFWQLFRGFVSRPIGATVVAVGALFALGGLSRLFVPLLKASRNSSSNCPPGR